MIDFEKNHKQVQLDQYLLENIKYGTVLWLHWNRELFDYCTLLTKSKFCTKPPMSLSAQATAHYSTWTATSWFSYSEPFTLV